MPPRGLTERRHIERSSARSGREQSFPGMRTRPYGHCAFVLVFVCSSLLLHVTMSSRPWRTLLPRTCDATPFAASVSQAARRHKSMCQTVGPQVITVAPAIHLVPHCIQSRHRPTSRDRPAARGFTRGRRARHDDTHVQQSMWNPPPTPPKPH